MQTVVTRLATRSRIVAVLALAVSIFSVLPMTRTASASAQAIPLPKIDCAALAPRNDSGIAGPGIRDFSAVVGAPTRIASASIVAKTADQPEYCDIKGYIAPQIQFGLRLPTKTWDGRYMQSGCGGLCGIVLSPAYPYAQYTFFQCNTALAQNFANGYDNEGHTGLGTSDGLWALNAPELRIDFGYRSEHVLALAAKAIIQAYYGQAPTYSYYNGCSDGGREALNEAQRYPDDFNGIIAGAPGIFAAPLAGMYQPWVARVSLDAKGKLILPQNKLEVLHKAVLAACDGKDGLVDGQIDDPRACDFDPASLRCPNDVDGANCLLPAQVEAIKKLYQGPVDAQGQHLYPGGIPILQG